ncbi:hypothetical protein RchiOBHm_Chr2g0100041 [Rosa chinensis]|uniref:Uncharacterized protein n=1 Tax=Rosa chinensis TaxID=74649 RepID=A0A2P6RM07_ROSCH|nr:hypothetical protein RchiOBHm_Chr2g0100041 [Rosa chinensis]
MVMSFVVSFFTLWMFGPSILCVIFIYKMGFTNARIIKSVQNKIPQQVQGLNFS